VLVGIGVLACAVALFFGDKQLGRRVAACSAFIVALLTVSAFVGHEWNAALGTDVYQAHRQAGSALVNGQNPYTDAVRFADGNPFAPPGRMVEGYPYPPLVLITYGLAGAFTDPRLVSVVSWLSFLGWFALQALSSRSKEKSEASLSVLMLLAFSALGSEVLFMGWTEPLSLLLFLGAALAWRRSPTWSGLLLGLALASKQYFIFLAPLLLLHRDDGWQRRSLTAVITAGGSMLIGLAQNPSAFVQATVGNLVAIGFRPDTQSLPGLAADLRFELLLPNAIWIGLSLLVAFLLARSSTSSSGFTIRSGLALGTAFMLGLAFPNYWFLVAGLLALGTVLDVDEVSETLPIRASTT